MDFAAYSFVDRITELDAGRSARGLFAVPRDIPEFSSCLVAEAVGQLAAWVAMSHVEFRGRPVAALANETLFAAEVRPGSMLQLAIEIEDVDEEVVTYKGWADVGGARIATLNDCLGPMLPVEEFDSPDVLRERFRLLCAGGAPAGRFHGVDAPRVDILDVVPGKSIAATLFVPETAAFFADHFPRRAVFPATLLLDAEIRIARKLAESRESRGGARLVPSRMTHVKMRSFIEPGAVLQVGAELANHADGTVRMPLTTTIDNRTVATARLEFCEREH